MDHAGGESLDQNRALWGVLLPLRFHSARPDPTKPVSISVQD